MPYILEDKIRVAISACNFGATVRYNLKGWNRVKDLGIDKNAFLWTPVCPEINSGLGVPRPTMKLVDGNGDDFWAGKARMKNREGKNISSEIRNGNILTMEIIKRAGCEAFIFMEGSPSCGVYRTTLKNTRLGKPPGTFGALALNEHLFLIPADDLQSPIKWWDWRRRLHAFVWLKRAEISTKKELYEIWHNFKFLCQEVDVKKSKQIGEDLANLDKFSAKNVDKWKSQVLRLLRKPSNLRRITAIMKKHFAHYNKHFSGKVIEMPQLNDKISKTKFVAQLNEMEKRAFLEGYDFAGVPVIFRGR